MADSTKRQRPEGGYDASNKKQKKGWTVPRKSGQDGRQSWSKLPHQPEAGWSGIWVTCNQNCEARSVTELRPLFEEHAARMYDLSNDDEPTEVTSDDVEDEIAKELASLRQRKSNSLFTSIPIDTKCLLFFKTTDPIDPIDFVISFCQHAAQSNHKQTRSVQRLTPVTLTGKATEKGLDDLAAIVLAPHFHGENTTSKKFAIRVSRRNHDLMTRDEIIRRVAAAVGRNHKVDLKDYDLLILVEIYQSSCGMSVVDKKFDTLKRFNLQELFTPKVIEDKSDA